MNPSVKTLPVFIFFALTLLNSPLIDAAPAKGDLRAPSSRAPEPTNKEKSDDRTYGPGALNSIPASSVVEPCESSHYEGQWLEPQDSHCGAGYECTVTHTDPVRRECKWVGANSANDPRCKRTYCNPGDGPIPDPLHFTWLGAPSHEQQQQNYYNNCLQIRANDPNKEVYCRCYAGYITTKCPPGIPQMTSWGLMPPPPYDPNSTANTLNLPAGQNQNTGPEPKN